MFNNTATDPTTVRYSGSGNKPLYLYNNASSPARKLSRTPMTVGSTYVEIPELTTTSWTQSPVLTSNVTLTSGNIPVRLWLSATSTRTYTIPVTLRCGATTVAQNLTGAIALNNGAAPVAFNITLPLASNYTCNAGNAFYLDVRNNQTGTGTRNIRVWPAPSTGNYSYVNLPSLSVIDITALGFYNDSYSGGSPITSISRGNTIYIRTTISDPFGAYDINGATLTLIDSLGAVILSGVSMGTEVASTAGTKTYEYAYEVPSDAALGTWTARVVTAEGTEGWVGDYQSATFTVVAGQPNIFILKSADKSNANPGEVITYTVRVRNDGTGPATIVTLTDSLGRYVCMPVTSSFTFTEGATPSGVTLGTPTYSQNNGGDGYTYTLSSVGCGGVPNYDGNVTNWNIIMNGNMNGSGGNFTLNYQVIVK
jgi:uncharacterized repeat protein (TIGR01451 family)